MVKNVKHELRQVEYSAGISAGCEKKTQRPFAFVFQSTRALACWVWYQASSPTTRSQRPHTQTATGCRRTPVCSRAGRGGHCCPSPSPSPANGCRWISAKRSWSRVWSYRGESTVRTKSSWRSSALATATTAPTGGWFWTPVGTSQRWLFLEACLNIKLDFTAEAEA